MLNPRGPLPNDHPHLGPLDGYYRHRRQGELALGLSFAARSGMPSNYISNLQPATRTRSSICCRAAPRSHADHTQFDGKIAYAQPLGPKRTSRRSSTLQPVQPAGGAPHRRQLHLRRGPAHRQRHPHDLKFAKTPSGTPITKNPNFGQTIAYQDPFHTRLGMRLSFLQSARSARGPRPARPLALLVEPFSESRRPSGDGTERSTGRRPRSAGRRGVARRSQSGAACSRVSPPPRWWHPGRSIDVEVDFAAGLPCCHIVGLADAGVHEGRVRIRGALENSGYKLPPRRITVNLAPADLRKDGAAFDVPIAVGMLCAAGVVERRRWRDTVRGRAGAGRRAAAGARRAAHRGVGRGQELRRLFVPPDNAARRRRWAGARCRRRGISASWSRCLRGEAPGVIVGGAMPSRRRAERALRRPIWPTCAARRCPAGAGGRGGGRSQHAVRRAAGLGQDDAGPRLAGILPPLTFDEALETTMVYSVAGLLGGSALVRRAPVSRAAPHRVDGRAGGRRPRPGPARSRWRTTACCSSTSCPSSAPALEACGSRSRIGRQHRARPARVTYPADFMLVAAMNPCPCGYLGSAVRACTCSSTAIGDYRARLSGPLLDRIDIHVDVPAMPYGELAESERGRIERRRAGARSGGARAPARHSEVWNARLGRRRWAPSRRSTPAGKRCSSAAARHLGLSARAITRVRRLARAIADLEGSAAVRAGHLAEALQYRVLDQPVTV